MNALILSCGTGGGHNAAAEAIRGELLRRGWNTELLNPYILCGKNAAKWLNQTYIRLVQRFPAGFGMIYRLGEMCQRLPFRSPVYLANGRAAVRLGEYLRGKRFDVIIATHLFPGEMVTRLKHGGAELPPVVYIATDYTCVPFTEDLDCDAYVIPLRNSSTSLQNGASRETAFIRSGSLYGRRFANRLQGRRQNKRCGWIKGKHISSILEEVWARGNSCP